MGFYQSKHKPEEITEERRKYLDMSTDARRVRYPHGYVSLQSIRTWQEYYDKHIPPAERLTTSAFRISSEINHKVSLWRGDITKLELDAIVNSAARIQSGEVNRAVMKAAGPFYKEECALEGLAPAGEAMVTGGYKLPAKYVINTLAPTKQDFDVLENCYKNSLEAAKEHGIQTLALPCIATRKRNRFPSDHAAKLALYTVRTWLEANHAHLVRLVFCVYKEDDLKAYRKHMQEYFPVISRVTYTPSADLTDSGEMQETSFLHSSSSESDVSSGSPPGAAAPKPFTRLSTNLNTIDDWQDATVRCESEMICVNRLNKDGLFKRLYSIYTNPTIDVTCCPSIKYEGEEGIDLGGMQREYFYQTLDVLTTTTYEGCPIFEGSIDHKLPFASRMHLQRKVFEAIGRALAHSILHGGVGFVGMSPAIVFLLSHRVSREEIEKSPIPVCLEDLPHEDLKAIFNVERCEQLTFDHKTVLRDYLDRGNIGWAGMDEDKFRFYKQELLMYEVVTRRWPQIEAIRSGMDSTASESPDKWRVGLYTMLCDNPTPENLAKVFPSQADLEIDVPSVTSRIRYDCQRDAEVVGFFTHLLTDLCSKIDELSLNTLLEFWTGHPLLPTEGSLSVEISSEDQLPSAHTCFYRLVLPGDHETYETFREAFVAALRHGARGFGEE